MSRIKLCHMEELSSIDSREFELCDPDNVHNIFIVRNGNSIYAYQNSCPHNYSPLNWNPDVFLSDDNEYIQCANHGALFEIESGACIYGPCAGEQLTQVTIEIENDIIFALF